MSSQVFHSKNEELEGEIYKSLSAEIAADVKIGAARSHRLRVKLQGGEDCLQQRYRRESAKNSRLRDTHQHVGLELLTLAILVRQFRSLSAQKF